MPTRGTTRATRSVVFQPATHRSIQLGVNQIANAVRPTLGPRHRCVAIDNADYHSKTPALFDDGAAIARHVIQLRDRDQNMGAMLLRDMLWRLQLQVGDGTATAAVVFAKVFNEGVRYLAAGGNAMQLRHGLEEGMHIVLDRMTTLSEPVEGREALQGIAESLCYDPELSKYLSEVFEIIGVWGRLEVREGRTKHVEREYSEGMYWDRGLLAREMYSRQSGAGSATPGSTRIEFAEAVILISDLEIVEPSEIYPVLELAIRNKYPALLIVADRLSDAVVSFLLRNKDPERFQAIAVRAPGWGKEQRAAALEDLAVLTGGRPFISVAGDTFHGIRPEHLGRARRIWADAKQFGIVGAKGDPRAVRKHIARLRSAHDLLETTQDREALQERIGKLMGGTATLLVGGATEMEVKQRLELAKRTATAMRAAMREGVLPGGGVAMLACRADLRERVADCNDPDERAAYRILIEAMEEPFRAIVSNAGYRSSDMLAEVRIAGAKDGRSSMGLNVLSGEVVDVVEAGILDATAVQKAVAYVALSTAALALTVDVLVHPSEPERASTPSPALHKNLQRVPPKARSSGSG